MGKDSRSHPDGSKLPADKGTFSRENASKPAPIPFPWVTSLPTGISLPTGTVTFLFTDIEGNTPLWERAPAAMEELHLALAAEAFATAWETGQGMTLEEAVDYAMGESD